MKGHPTRFRENYDLPLWRGPAVKKKPPFSNARADHLLRREIMRSRDAQCNTGNDVKLPNHTIDLYHTAAILSPRRTKSFVLTRLASH